jgi:hypothetical protein
MSLLRVVLYGNDSAFSKNAACKALRQSSTWLAFDMLPAWSMEIGAFWRSDTAGFLDKFGATPVIK